MRALLSTIGSRGDVEPLVALALELRAAGAAACLCVPPDFQARIGELGLEVAPIGPALKALTAGPRSAVAPKSPDELAALARETVAVQFETVARAAAGCDVIVAATALQIAARSVAEKLGIRYEFVAYCPVVLPSPRHAPPPMPRPGALPAPPDSDHRELWREEARRFNAMFGDSLNAHRSALGLSAIDEVQRHVFGDRPWLAADPTLGPWPNPDDASVLQTGAWMVDDQRALAPELERFLGVGEPPIYFGLGSMRAPQSAGAAMLEAARALGRRAIVSRGWADLALDPKEPDCLVIDEVNHQALFARVAAVAHHGGAGTTTAAASSGAPQVVAPQLYDQHYWGARVVELGIGSAHPPGAVSKDALASALERALKPEVAERARAVASSVRRDGARRAAQRLMGIA